MKRPKYKKLFIPRVLPLVKDGDLMVGKQARADAIMAKIALLGDYDLHGALKDWRVDYGVDESYYVPGAEVHDGLAGSWVLREITEPEVNEWGEVGA